MMTAPNDIARTAVEYGTFCRGEKNSAVIFMDVIVGEAKVPSSILLVQGLIFVLVEILSPARNIKPCTRVRVEQMFISV
jgi:hypothetical protein